MMMVNKTYSKRHRHQHTRRVWQLIVENINIFRDSVKHTTQRRCIKEQHWQAKQIFHERGM
jgi:hypothetical protein